LTEGVRPSIFERNPRKTLAALILVAVGGTDLAFTGVYHWLSPRPAARGQTGLRIRSDVFHHGFQPLASVRDIWGSRLTEYRINSLGLRDTSARQVPLRSTRRRLLFIGDSFTEGIGVAYDETFVGRIARVLEPAGVEVFNAGCASYSPVIYYRKVRWLLDEGFRFDNLVVFIDMGDPQDEVTYYLDGDGNVASDELRRLREERENIRYPLPRFLHDLTVRKFLKRNTIGLFALYELMEQAVRNEDRRDGLWTADPRLFEQFGREGLTRARGNMDLLADLVRKHGIRLTVAVYPWPDQIRRNDLQSLQVSVWKQWASDRGVEFLDYFPRFVDPARREEILAHDFIRGDIHWNEAGHQVVADGFLESWAGALATERALPRHRSLALHGRDSS
jgi:hypothetical protein